MVLVISNIANKAAASLVELFPPGAAFLLTGSNFFQAFSGGIEVNDFEASKICVGGQYLPVSAITGVITTISNFVPAEFYYVQETDREYVCAEMSAFFTWFLSQLKCKQINPPSMRTLSGPGLHKIEWIPLASAAGIPVWPVRLVNSNPADFNLTDTSGFKPVKCTVIGDEFIGEQPPGELRTCMAALQEMCNAPFLTGHFLVNDDRHFFLAELSGTPDISAPETREAVVRYFLN